MGPLAVMAGALAGISCQGTVMAALASGTLATVLMPRLLVLCITYSLPATACSILATAGSGLMSAATGALLAPYTRLATGSLRLLLRGPWPPYVGFVAGVSMCVGSKVGAYHWLALPVILLEMETGQPSVIGTLDFCCLVLVSAGLPQATLLQPAPTLANHLASSRVYHWFRNEYFRIFSSVSEPEPGLLIPNMSNISEYFRISEAWGWGSISVVQCLFVVRSVSWSIRQLFAPSIQSQGDKVCSWQQSHGQGHIFVPLW